MEAGGRVTWHSTRRTEQLEQSCGGRNKSVLIRRRKPAWGARRLRSPNLGFRRPQRQAALAWGCLPGNHQGRRGSCMGPGVCPIPPSCSTEKHEAFLSAGWRRESRSLRGQIPITITLKHRFEGRGARPVQNTAPPPLRSSSHSSFLSKAKPPAPKPEEQRSALCTDLGNSQKHWGHHGRIAGGEEAGQLCTVKIKAPGWAQGCNRVF